jgi:hypothetical protein
MAFHAALAFEHRFFSRLIDPIFCGQCVIRLRQIVWNRNGRSETIGGSSKSQVPNSKAAPKAKQESNRSQFL